MKSNFKNILSLFSANIAVKALGVGSVMVLTRFLTKEELSLLPNYMVVAGLAIILSSFGLLPTLVREIPILLQEKQFDRARAIIHTSLLLILPMLTMVSVAAYLFSTELSIYLLDSDAYTLHFKIIALSIAFDGIRQFFDYGYWAYDMFSEQSRLLVVEGVTKVILNVVGVIYYGAMGLVVSLAVTSLVSCIVSIYYFRHVLFVNHYQTVSLKYLLGKSWPFYLESYLMYFRSQGDQLIVTTFLGPELLAVYFVAKKLYDVLQIFARSLDKVFTGSLAKLKGKSEQFSTRVSEIFTMNSFLLIPFFALCVGLTPLFIEIIAGSKYLDAVPASTLLTLTLLVHFFHTSTFGRSIFLLKPSTSRFKLTLVESVSLALFSLLFIKLLSVEGVALARLLTVCVTGLYGYFYTRRDIDLSVDRKSIVVVLVASAMMTAILLIVQDYSHHVVVVAAAALLAIGTFLVVVNRSISKEYYSFINLFFPFRVADPLGLLHDKLFPKKTKKKVQ